MKPGEIYWVKFDPSIGFEIQKSRPRLIIQKPAQRNTVIVLPISSKRLSNSAFEIKLVKDSQNQLYSDSVVILDQVKSFDKRRFIEKIGNIQNSQLSEIVKKFKHILH